VVTIVETINATKSGIACECEPNPWYFVFKTIKLMFSIHSKQGIARYIKIDVREAKQECPCLLRDLCTPLMVKAIESSIRNLGKKKGMKKRKDLFSCFWWWSAHHL